jgi:F-type H+-transporting ATPase subunit epsilon
MAQNTLQVEVVTPEKMLFSGQAEMVEIAGAEGDLGVLPLHAPLVSLLRAGLVRVHQQGSVTEFPVTGGLAQVDAEKCVILAEVA